MQRDAARPARSVVVDNLADGGSAGSSRLHDDPAAHGGVPQSRGRGSLPVAAARDGGARAGAGYRAECRVDPASSERFPRIPREDGRVTTVNAAEPNRVLVVGDERAITDLVP